MILLTTLATMLFAPESPRCTSSSAPSDKIHAERLPLAGLIEAGRVDEGRRVLARLHGQAYADAATTEIQDAIAVEHAAQRGKGYSACFSKYVVLLSAPRHR